MRSLAPFWHLFWFVRVALLPVLLTVIVRRRLHRQFPVFAAYIGCSVVAGVAFVGMNYIPSITGDQYFQGIVMDSIVETILSFAVIYELFALRVRHYPALRAVGVSAFRWATVFLLAIAIALAWVAPGKGEGQLMAKYDVVTRTVGTLQCGLLVFLFVFCSYFRLPWRSHAFGIAMGLGILTSVNVASYAIRSQMEPTTFNLITDLHALVNEGTYLGCVSLWLVYIRAPEPAPQTPARSLPEHDLETWSQELRRFLQQ